MLPQLSPEIPRVLKLRHQAQGQNDLAEALLAEGMLKESDWTGDVRTSLRAGLARWIEQTLGGEPLRRIFLAIGWTNELAPGMTPELWLKGEGGRSPLKPICFLTLTGPVTEEGGEYDEGRDVFVGRKVRALNDLRPGLGFQVFGLLQDVLGRTVNAFGPGQAYGHLQPMQQLQQKWEELKATYPEEATRLGMDRALELAGWHVPSHGVTLPELLDAVPEGACACVKPRTNLIHETLKQGAPAELRPVLEKAAELDRVRQIPAESLRCDTPLFLDTRFSPSQAPGGVLKEFPFAVRWAPDDPLPRSGYHQQLEERDLACNILWMRAWQPGAPHQVRRAVRDWRRVLSVSLKACRLAELMHSELGLHERTKQ